MANNVNWLAISRLSYISIIISYLNGLSLLALSFQNFSYRL